MHIPHYDNNNVPIVGSDDEDVPLAYFNIVRLKKGESFVSDVPGYETCLVPAHGTIDVQVHAVEHQAPVEAGSYFMERPGLCANR